MSVAFWSRVAKAGPDECWLWTGSLGGADYGRSWDPVAKRRIYAHRLAYELLVGPIPEGLELDHLCNVRLCVNPAHLEPVTRSENMRRTRQTVCQNGHDLTAPGALVMYPRGGRACRLCRRERHRLYMREYNRRGR